MIASSVQKEESDGAAVVIFERKEALEGTQAKEI